MAFPSSIVLIIGGKIRRCSRNPIPSLIIDPTDDGPNQCVKIWRYFLRHLIVTNELLRIVTERQLRKELKKIKSVCFYYLYILKHMKKGKLNQITSGWNNLLEAHNQEKQTFVKIEEIIETIKTQEND